MIMDKNMRKYEMDKYGYDENFKCYIRLESAQKNSDDNNYTELRKCIYAFTGFDVLYWDKKDYSMFEIKAIKPDQATDTICCCSKLHIKQRCFLTYIGIKKNYVFQVGNICINNFFPDLAKENRKQLAIMDRGACIVCEDEPINNTLKINKKTMKVCSIKCKKTKMGKRKCIDCCLFKIPLSKEEWNIRCISCHITKKEGVYIEDDSGFLSE